MSGSRVAFTDVLDTSVALMSMFWGDTVTAMILVVLYCVYYFVDYSGACVHVGNVEKTAVVEDRLAESLDYGLGRYVEEGSDLRMRHSDVVVE
tara:strand:+ start:50 stop:328 length:279 start_codon:yes stop_codon:yes gene_type:complete